MLKRIGIILGIFMFCILAAGYASAYNIPDNYWGGVTNYSYPNQDVIGEYQYFGIDSMDISLSGNTLAVTINGPYFSAYTHTPNLTYNMQPGDLFITTTGWNPVGTALDHYSTDTYLTTGTTWQYAFTLGAGGNGNLYRTADGSVTLTNIENINPPGNYIYRTKQAWQFSPAAGSSAISSGNWWITGNQLFLSFDLGGISFGDSIGLHWAEQCGNDVIEGTAPVPEASALLLLCSGLVGLVGFGKKFKK